MTSGAGKAFVAGGTAVAATLGGFYYSLQNAKRKEEEMGKNPRYEQVMAHMKRKPVPGEELPVLSSPKHKYSDNPPAFRGDVHNSGHATLQNYKNTPQYLEHGEAVRYMVPPPQKGRSDGSGKPYTKSPDYAKNYEKTVKSSSKESAP
ncbi:unnamed protein product [Cyclocybe aegerita]|uniref:Uncharacterized protein n=1 Tax=Cyclocybe aegerita TaxID=1973307 RepID=A0A8S0W669_CYCAE|nr:unnamed protein product [Cyclocybe aegerita]